MGLRERLEHVCQIARDNLGRVQGRQKEYYDKRAKEREFQIGDQVLMMLPDNDRKLLFWWQGPFKIMRRIGLFNYEVEL